MPRYSKTEVAESLADLRSLLNPHNLRRSAGEWARDHKAGNVTISAQVTNVCVRNYLPTVYFVIDSVSRSGMSRKMRVYVQQPDGELRYIASRAAKVLGWSCKREWRDSIIVHGCGMDMTFHLLDCLCRAVFGYGPEALNANHFRRETL